jgi:hypothetical protein
METTLLAVTVISVAVAIYAFAASRRMQRQQRERADARVAALSAAADAPAEGWTQVGGEWQWNRSLDRPIERDPDPEPRIQTSSDRFFGTVEREEPSGSRLPVFAAAGLIAVLGGALIFLNTSATGDPPAAATQAAHTDPLELVSLGHSRDARTLTITGTVRNPSSGPKLEGLTAVVTLLDNSGTLVSTKDVPLDYRALGPGEEAPFKVSIPDRGVISRYRVSFRAGTDVVPHVDRRGDTKLASALR